MSKKTNTLLFVLGATVFNILATIIIFFGLFLIYARFFAHILPEETMTWGFTIIFVGSIVLTFLLYRLILKHLMKKIDFDKHFDPIFGSRKK